MSATWSPLALGDAFAVVARWLDGDAGVAVSASRADELAERFGLDPFARNLLLLGAYAALEPQAGTRIAELHGDPARTAPSLGLALARLPGANWASLGPSAPLRRSALISIGNDRSFAAAPFALAEPALMALVGAPSLCEELALQARRVEPADNLAPARQRLCAAIGLRLAVNRPITIQLCGADPLGKEQASATAVAATGRPMFAIGTAVLPTTAGEILRLAQLWRRDLLLSGGQLYIDATSLAETANLTLFAAQLELPLIVAAPDPLMLGHGATVRLDMPRMTAAEQAPLWRERLGSHARQLNGSIERLASHFAASPELIDSVAAEISVLAPAATGKPAKSGAKAAEEPPLDTIAWDAARRFARPRMDDLARRIESDAGWDEIILPSSQKSMLKAIAAQVRNRAMVYETWGFAQRTGGRGLGVSALFAGPSGAGKTLAGEILGAELKLDVYRIDLSAIVSKWIGETEKNLRRVFDAAEEGSAVLQFDEADALFGKRTEVKDSHDRHANIEVSYLLQRLEEYRGLSILTTNFRSNIDPAFLRRLRFIIDFDFPSLAERVEIWQRIFPKDTPRKRLDYALLGQLNMAGGSIRNVAMGAAFLAADAGQVVTMGHILTAARFEYEKSGRTLTDGELRGWAP